MVNKKHTVPVLGSPSDISMQPCESVASCPLSCEFYGRFKPFKIFVSDFDIMSMHRQFCPGTYQFLTTVTKSVVHGVKKVVIRSSIIRWGHTVS